MAFSSTTIQPVSHPVAEKSVDHTTTASLLSMLVLSVYAANKSKKNFRKLKRQFLWTTFKLKAKAMFSRKREVSDRTLIYILLAVIALVLVFTYPILALIVAAVALILILTGVI